MYSFKVESMSCEGCLDAVERVLKSVDSKAEVDIDLDSKDVRIESACPLESFKAALQEAGYPAS